MCRRRHADIRITPAFELLEREGLVDDCVVLTTGPEPLAMSPLASCDVSISTSTGWQDEVRNQFGNAFRLDSRKGVVSPEAGEPWGRAMLDGLSKQARPSQADVALVQQIASTFFIKRAVREQLAAELDRHSAFRWQLSRRGAGGTAAAKCGGSLIAAEIPVALETVGACQPPQARTRRSVYLMV